MSITREFLLDWLTNYVAKDGDFYMGYAMSKLEDKYDENIYLYLKTKPKQELISLLKRLDYYKISPFLSGLVEGYNVENLAKLIMFLSSGKNVDVMSEYFEYIKDDQPGIASNTFLEHASTLDISDLKDLIVELLLSEKVLHKGKVSDEQIMKGLDKVIKMKKYN